MTRIMDAAAVREIRQEMDKARTSKKARRRMAEIAIEFGDKCGNLTACGKAEWLLELN